MNNGRVTFNSKPAAINYIALPTTNGEADVWLRKNIAKSGSYWYADEVYMRTTALQAEIVANFELFYDYARAWTQLEYQLQQIPPALEARVAMLEDALLEIFESSGEYSVCKIYAYMIRFSEKTLEDVPEHLRETVQRILYFGGYKNV